VQLQGQPTNGFVNYGFVGYPQNPEIVVLPPPQQFVLLQDYQERPFNVSFFLVLPSNSPAKMTPDAIGIPCMQTHPVHPPSESEVRSNARFESVTSFLHIPNGLLCIAFGIASLLVGSWGSDVGHGIWSGALVSLLNPAHPFLGSLPNCSSF
jgi:hypothetical protein